MNRRVTTEVCEIPTETVDFIGWLTQKTRFFEIELSNLGSMIRQKKLDALLLQQLK